MHSDPRDDTSTSADPIDELLVECLELSANAQPARLEVLCAQHPDHAEVLRRRHAFLQEVGLAGVVDTLGSTAPDEALPERIGDYRLLRRLGGGGMGVVHLATQLSLGRQVALKLIRADHLHSPTARERFRREALAVSRLDHPNICTVHEVGEVDGQPYLAMRYVDGETLDAWIARARVRGTPGVIELPRATESSFDDRASDSGGRSAIPRVVHLFEKIARAVHTAHEAGLVHRDLKPGNVMITADGDPVVLDFGLARDESQDGLRQGPTRLRWQDPDHERAMVCHVLDGSRRELHRVPPDRRRQSGIRASDRRVGEPAWSTHG